MGLEDQLLVSICCQTYNHEKFIAQCLDGFVMQKTNFRFEILVHEDASTDNTASIIKEYESKYPDLFRCVYQTVNQYAIQNTLSNILLPMSKGKYIALCEGDDYWTDPLKLQKQVDFLEKNEEFSICAHAVKKIDGNSEKLGIFSKPGIYTRIQFLKDYSISTLSTVFRNIKIDYSLLNKYPTGDFPLFMMLLENHKAYVMPEIMGVHRTHEGGAWSMKGQIYQAEIAIKNFESMQENLKLSDDEAQFITNKLTEFKEILSYYKNPLTGFIKGEISLQFLKKEVVNNIKKKLIDSFVAKKS